MQKTERDESATDIALIGMACRFPGANNVAAYWQNLCNGVESILPFSEQELVQAGIDPAVLQDARYVKAGAVLDDFDCFDAAFFGLNPREAAIIDPQHRLILECAWEALEYAGYNPETYPGLIGMYAGTGTNTYLFNLLADRHLMETMGWTQVAIGNDKDYLVTRVAYKLKLRGPGVTVQTACSTSLVAIHLACQSLLNRECDMALAGGVRIRVPHRVGYVYQAGGILSPDGHCRAFDARAQGTVSSSGAGIVVLKRLADALADGDGIYAVIKGTAINNDGAAKVGYTAPSIEGQAAVIAEALAVAEVQPETITSIEAHGTGTVLGDPIEVAALTRVFAASTRARQFCALGSVKTNIGHTDTAAGVAGLIKTALALQHQMLPPSLHFDQPNPQIDLVNSPFFVNTTLLAWPAGATPRRAGVSAFGIGGTNAHIVVEEAQVPSPSGPSRPCQLLVLSAKTASALDTVTANLSEHCQRHPALNLADVAFTLQQGRKAFSYRRMLVCQSLTEASNALTTQTSGGGTRLQESQNRPVVFLFPGQGSQYVHMGYDLYQCEPTFRQHFDRCCDILRPHVERDVRQVLYPPTRDSAEAAQSLHQTAFSQPALFAVEYALAQLWLEWGVCPQAMLGHSVGEYVAACLAGVLSLEDALSLIAARGRLMQHLPAGKMLAIPLPFQEVQALLGAELSLAAVNAPSLCVVSGPQAAVTQCATQLAARGVSCHQLQTSHAFHSTMMEPVLEAFVARVAAVSLQPPHLPYISNVTGTWITAAEATNPHYWAQHLRQTVYFAQGLTTLLEEPQRLLLEVGPGHTLSTFARQYRPGVTEPGVFSSLRSAHERRSDVAGLLHTLGQLWLAGVSVNWGGFAAHERRHRVPLPTYPFERQRYWIEPQSAASSVKIGVDTLPQTARQSTKLDMADWFSVPTWRPSEWPATTPLTVSADTCWLIFDDAYGLGSHLQQRLIHEGHDVVAVQRGATFARQRDGVYTLNPAQPQDYEALVRDLHLLGKHPRAIVHLWNVSEHAAPLPAFEGLNMVQEEGFYSLLSLVQSLGKYFTPDTVHITVVSTNLHAIEPDDVLSPQKATLLGPCRVIPLEYPHLTCRSIDVTLPGAGSPDNTTLSDRLYAECTAASSAVVVAYRGQRRLVQTFEPLRLGPSSGQGARLRERGVYLITGGLGGIGLVLAEQLARLVQAKLILTGRSALPARQAWEQWLSAHAEHDPVSRRIRHVQELEATGAEVLIVSANVADEQQMRQAITLAEQRFGTIHGVIHAAGLPDGALIQRRGRDMSEAVLAPKVQGTLVLDRVLRQHQVDFFVLCSSLSSVFAPPGQVAYSAANAFLDAFAPYKTARDGTFTVAINWDAWQEVGMAVATSPQVTTTPAERVPRQRPVQHPLFERCLLDGNQEIYLSSFRGSEHWVLHEHKIMGVAVLPGTAYLEMARAAFAAHRAQGATVMRDVYFLSPLLLHEHDVKDVRTVLTPHAEGYKFAILSRAHGSAEAWQLHTTGEIAALETEPPRQHHLSTLQALCQHHEEHPTSNPQTTPAGLIAFGPRWQSVQWLRWASQHGLAYLELPATFTSEVSTYGLHPALLDAATAFLVSKVKDGGRYLPFSYQTVKIQGPLPSKIYSYSHYREQPQGQRATLQFDLTIMDEQGTALVEIEGYTLRRIDEDHLSGTLAQATEVQATAEDNFHVGMTSPGNLETITRQPAPRRPPAPGEVEIAVQAAGLNFKEVLLALGMLPPPPDGRLQFGLECAGTIVAVGEGVEEVAVGDAVVALGSGCLSPYVTTAVSSVALKPDHLSFAEAATIPIAFLTAYYALVTVGKLSPGERVLIHAAAGGVGLAAVTIAQWVGAEIFATAGNPEKRQFLHALGIAHVMDSRSLAFAEEIMQHTKAQGVHVVLNALAGEFIPKSLEAMAPYGRFLDIGVRDSATNNPFGPQLFARSLSCFIIMVGAHIPHFRAIWQEVVQHFHAGHFAPLPLRVFPVTEIAPAFAYMAQARHIGKIVVTYPTSSQVVIPRAVVDAARPRRRAHQAPKIPSSGILPAEGAEAFCRILDTHHPQILVSTRALGQRDLQDRERRERRFQDMYESLSHNRSVHIRPQLHSTYVAPRNAMERFLAECWQELLGIDQVGMHDNFFELGGHSLLAIQVLSRIRSTFEVEVALPTLFETATVESLAQAVLHSQGEQHQSGIPRLESSDRSEAAQLLEQLDQLSDEEVETLLRDRFHEDPE